MKRKTLAKHLLLKKVCYEQLFKLERPFWVLIIILALSLYSGHADAQSTRISISQANAKLEKVLNEIEKKTDYFFIYSNQINKGQKVSASFSDTPVSEILNSIFKDTGITFELKEKHILLTSKNEKAIVEKQRAETEKKITGTIKDVNGEPIIGASIKVKNSIQGTVTNLEGDFTLFVTPESRLEISYIGYKPIEQTVGMQNHLIITLIEDTELLDEVVVVGYGTQKKGSLATAITTVKSEVLQDRAVPTIGEALQGQVAGLRVTPSSQPGKESSLQLRGVTSLNDGGSPLVLVDGVPSDFNFLNPEDIETISVLKDAASSAIYGSRAASGVLLITTKRGKTGKPTFHYSGSAGVNTPTDLPELCDSPTYVSAINEAEANMKRKPVWSNEDIALFKSGADPDRYPSTDWFKLGIHNSFTTRHSIEATGGNDAVKYLLSASYDHQTGVIPQNKQDVFNVRSNTDVAISKKLNVSFDIRYQLRSLDEVNIPDGIYSMLFRADPTMVAYYQDGSYGYNAGFYQNPLLDINESGHRFYDRHDASGIFKFDYEIIDGLKFTGIGNVNYVFYNTSTQTKMLRYYNPFAQTTTTKYNNDLDEKREYKGYFNLQALLTYKKTFGKHDIDALVGYQQENEKKNWISAGRSGYPTALVWQLNAGPTANWKNDGNADHWAIASVIGRLNYAFDSKYMLSASFRSDASSRFASGHRWSTFPSVAAAWRISNEAFMENTKSLIDDLKLRASWGQNGSATGLGLYPSYTTIGMGSAVFNKTWTQTAKLNAIGNTELGWERTEMLNFGIDLKTLNNRLSLSAEYYIKTTKDILIGLPVPLEYGFGDPSVNIGKMENRGWEIELRWNDKIGKVGYGIAGNLSDNRNKVLDLAGTGPWKSGYTDVGLPFRSIYGYESLGLFQSEEEVANAPFQNMNTHAGDIRYKNQNDDSKINADDRVVIGDPYPHFLYGLNLNADYKGFDLSMYFQGIGSKDLIMMDEAVRPLNASPLFKHQLDYWSPTNTDAKYPRILNKTDASHNYEVSDFWMINAGYLRMKSLQIGYTIPKNILAKTGFSKIRVYCSANNLFTISNFVPGWDPEITSAISYPFSRTYSFGLNLQF